LPSLQRYQNPEQKRGSPCRVGPSNPHYPPPRPPVPGAPNATWRKGGNAPLHVGSQLRADIARDGLPIIHELVSNAGAGEVAVRLASRASWRRPRYAHRRSEAEHRGVSNQQGTDHRHEGSASSWYSQAGMSTRKDRGSRTIPAETKRPGKRVGRDTRMSIFAYEPIRPARQKVNETLRASLLDAGRSKRPSSASSGAPVGTTWTADHRDSTIPGSRCSQWHTPRTSSHCPRGGCAGSRPRSCGRPNTAS
jgi:hypothetical protein